MDVDNWWMRFHPRALDLKFAKGVKRPDKSNAIDMLCSGQVPPRSQFEVEDYESKFEEVPEPFTEEERRDWLGTLNGVAVSSDAFVSLAPRSSYGNEKVGSTDLMAVPIRR